MDEDWSVLHNFCCKKKTKHKIHTWQEAIEVKVEDNILFCLGVKFLGSSGAAQAARDVVTPGLAISFPSADVQGDLEGITDILFMTETLLQ